MDCGGPVYWYMICGYAILDICEVYKTLVMLFMG